MIAIAERVKAGDTVDNKELRRQLSLVLTRKDLMNASFVDAIRRLKDMSPLQRETTSDLFAGYGRFTKLDKEPAKVKLRAWRGELREVGKVLDLLRKQPPKASGMEKAPKGDKERRLTAVVNDLKRRSSIKTTDPETQLKTSQDAIKTRMRNEMRDLEHAIATWEPLPDKTSSTKYDEDGCHAAAARRTRKGLR